MDNRISAGELRSLGIKLPETIPDCATVSRTSVHMNCVDSYIEGEDNLIIDIVASFDMPFEWIKLDLIIDKQGNIKNG